VVLSEELTNLPEPLVAAWRWIQENPIGTKPEITLTKRARQVQRRLDEAEQIKVIKEYQSGLTVYEVGAAFGIHRTTVSAILKRHQVKLRRAVREPHRVRTNDAGE
jgi:DNA-directed RNA polymerase specialized sigma subunit